MRRLHWVLLLAVGGLLAAMIAGCTPKPSEEQLKTLSQTCALAGDAERASDATVRQLRDVERTLAGKRRALAEREAYQQKVRANLKKM